MSEARKGSVIEHARACGPPWVAQVVVAQGNWIKLRRLMIDVDGQPRLASTGYTIPRSDVLRALTPLDFARWVVREVRSSLFAQQP